MKIIGPPVISPTGQAMPISNGVECQGLIFLSGQLSIKDGVLQGETGAEQMKICIDNIETLLAAEGLTLAHVMKSTIWISAGSIFLDMNAEYSKRFSAPYPARLVVVSALAIPGALVEIDVIASRGESRLG